MARHPITLQLPMAPRPTEPKSSRQVLPSSQHAPASKESPARTNEAGSAREPHATRSRQDEDDRRSESALPSGLIPGPWYYPARYLHRRSSPLRPIWPDYPLDLETVRGHVVILLLISEEGKVDHYRIESADPAGPFEASVIKAFTSSSYAPGLIAGQKVKSQLLAEVFFEPGMPPRAAFSIMENAIPVQGPASSLGSGN